MGFDSMINRIPQKITGRTSSATSIYVPSDNIFQWAIGGYPLLSSTSPERQDVETGAEQRKQQFDNYKDPGEYSLTQWWLRSQSEFNGGEGIVYQDPDTQNTYLLAKNTRYDTGLGIDPFTDYSRISLLPQVNQSSNYSSALDNGAGFPTYVQSFSNPGFYSDAVFLARGTKVRLAPMQAGDISGTTNISLPNDGSTFGITGGIAVSGATGNSMIPTAFVYLDQGTFGTNDGVWSVDAGGFSHNIYAGDSTHSQKTIAFVKAGLVLASGNLVYQLPNLTGVRTALPAAAATLPPGQTVVSMTEGPDGLYVAANSGHVGYIYKATYDNNLANINGLQQIAVLPEGEQINTISFYVGTYLAIATDLGVRIANVTNAGLQYGPLIFQVPKVPGQTNGFKGIGFFGSLAFFGTYSQSTPKHDGAWGIYCVDLGTVNSDSVTGFTTNAYARWVYSASTALPISDLTVTQSGRLVYATVPANSTTQSLLWVQHATNLVSQGYLVTGRCRFNTVEPKLFKYFSLRSPQPLKGSLTASVLDEGGGETTYITYTNANQPGTQDVAISNPSGPQNWIKLKFYLNRDADPTQGAQMNNWQIKALPGVIKQRMISKWFNCFNKQQDLAGQTLGNDDYAYNTLAAIKQMYQRGDVVTLQDLIHNESILVVLDNYQFVMDAPPGPGRENFGGFLRLDMRTVADAVPPTAQITGVPVD